MKTLLAYLFTYLFVTAISSQSVIVDESWAEQGFATFEMLDEHLWFNDYIVAESGDIYAVGFTQETGSTFKKSILVKINSDGSIDSDFGEDGMIRPELYYDEDHQFDDVLLRDDGTILVVGNMQSGQGPAISAFFMSFNADGTLDTSYGDNGFSEEYGGMGSGTGYPDIYQGNSGDSFLIRSYFHQTNDYPEITVMRQGANSFNYFLGDGFNGWFFPHEAYISPDDAFFLPLSYNGFDYGQGTAAIAKFDETWIDDSFGIDGIYEYEESVPGDSYRHADEMNGGDIIVAGLTQIDDHDNILITQLNASGVPNENFGTDGHLIFGEEGYDYLARSVHYLESENTLIASINKSDGTTGAYGLLAVNPDGSIQNGFGQDGIFWTDNILPGSIRQSHLLDDGSLLFSGVLITSEGLTTSYFGKVNFDFEYQNFQSGLMGLNSAQTSYFREFESGRIYALEIENASFEEDSIFTPRGHWYESGFQCYLPEYCSILGKEIRVSADGTHKFITGLNDTISVLFQADLGQTWIAYTSQDGELTVQAEVTGLEIEEHFGDEILVKTIDLQMLDNDWYFKFSAELGLMAFPSLAKFPDFEQLEFEQGAMKELVGFEGQEGVNNLERLEIFNFDVGDQIHIEQGSSSSIIPGTTSLTQEAWIILDKEVYTDSIIYDVEIRRWAYSGLTSELNIQPTDTTFETLIARTDSLFDLPPGRSLINNLDGEGTFGWLQEGEFGVEKNFYFDDPVYAFGVDSCFITAIDWGCSGGQSIEHYFEGLGGPYYICESSDFSTYWRTLKYFQKGDEEWGEPLNVKNQGESQGSLKIYPNPASNQIRIDLDYRSQNLEIRILEITGKLIRESAYTSTVDVSSLPGGIYFLQVIEDNRIIASSKFIVQE